MNNQSLDPHLEEIFLIEIIDQCKITITAFNVLKEISNQQSNRNLIWGLVFLILNSSANISKIFWHNDENKKGNEKYKKYQDRAKHLRVLLMVKDSSPLNSRHLRNDFEHFDERLHDWAEKSPTKNVVYRAIAPEGSISIEPVDEYADMGSFDQYKFNVTFRSNRFEIIPVINEIETILKIAEVKLNERIFKH